LGVIIYDLNNLLNQINLNEIEKEILNLWRNSNSMQTNIAKTLNVKRHFVDSTLNSICKRIVDKYKEQYEDWLYLNYLRGEYKRCSKCGEIKLISSFNKDASRRDGYKYICRKCEYVDKNDFKNGK
jgi:predicted DNA-binding protein (UPF0251 family)